MQHVSTPIMMSLYPAGVPRRAAPGITRRDLIPDLGLATGAVILTSIAIWAMLPSLGEKPSLVLFPAVAAALTSWQGLGPGLLASSLGTTIGSFLFIRPFHVFEARTGTLPVDTLLLFASSILICLLIYRLKAEHDSVKDVHDRRNDALAFVAHELRQPLATVRLAAEMLERESSEETRMRATKLITHSAERLGTFIEDLVDVTRLQRHGLEIAPRLMRIQDAVLAAAQAAGPAIAHRHQFFDIDVRTEPSLWVNADPSRLQQVFANLLSNACRYSPEGTRISLSVREQDRDAVVTVRDTGVGIEQDMLERIFDPFVRAPGAGLHGLGIGLALVRNVIALHGGRVTAHTDGPGRGSTFVVRLPLVLDSHGRGTSD